MLKNYAKELAAIAVAFGLLSYTIYVCAAEPVKAKPAAVKKAEPAKAAKPAKKEAAKPAEPKKEHKKKPTLKAKYADKK
jgi:hypothetical protein